MLDNLPYIKHVDRGNFFLIAGPCVVESEEICLEIAESIVDLSEKYGIPYVFKASYKKANRSKIDSFTGIGDIKGLEVIDKVRSRFDIPILTDIHSEHEAELASKFVDIIQIPAFLSRQTDLLIAAAKTDKYVNIKKGQFMSPTAMQFTSAKISETGNDKIILTDRGTMFGYQDLIVDFRGITEMKTIGYPVVMDVTHSLQQPNQSKGISGGKPEMIETISRAAIAVGVDGIFIETHPDPSKAKSDGSNMLPLHKLDGLLYKLTELKATVNKIS